MYFRLSLRFLSERFVRLFVPFPFRFSFLIRSGQTFLRSLVNIHCISSVWRRGFIVTFIAVLVLLVALKDRYLRETIIRVGKVTGLGR